MKIDEYEIQVNKKNVRTLSIKIYPSGEIRVTAPLCYSENQIYEFIISKKKWIDKHMSEISRDKNYLDFIHMGKVRIFGEEYLLINSIGDINKSYIDGDKFIISTKKLILKKDLEKYVEIALKIILINEISFRLPYFENRLKLYSSSFIVKNMKSRWGSCNVKTKKICFNLQLVKKDKICLDYIIVHELGHLLNKSHNKAFHKYMDINFPDWKKANKLLNI